MGKGEVSHTPLGDVASGGTPFSNKFRRVTRGRTIVNDTFVRPRIVMTTICIGNEWGSLAGMQVRGYSPRKWVICRLGTGSSRANRIIVTHLFITINGDCFIVEDRVVKVHIIIHGTSPYIGVKGLNRFRLQLVPLLFGHSRGDRGLRQGSGLGYSSSIA